MTGPHAGSLTIPRISRRAESLGTENAFVVLAEVNALAREGRDIVSFCIGQPDFPTPRYVQEAAIVAIKSGKHGYTPSAGIDELRAAAAQDLSARRGLEIRPEDVVVAAGAKPFIAYTIASVTDYGADDEVIYPVPGFPIYESQIVANGAVPVPIYLRESRDFAFDPHELEAKITPKTRLLILNSPQNPTGGVLSKAAIHDIADAIGDRNIMIMSDEIYSRLIFEGEHFSIMSIPGFKERTILLDGFSKTYAMTGWRMGYGVMRSDLAAHVTRLMTNSNSCTASFTQMAGIEALRGDQSSVDRMREEFRRRRDAFVAGLNRIKGFSCRMPKGAFYTFPNITATGWPSKKLANAILEEAGVACLSGTAFGDFGEGYLRFSVANSLENLNKALDRIQQWTAKNL
jgi:aspartate/methionine/tyrosine aminotransferase